MATITGVIDGIGSLGAAVGQLPTAAISEAYGWAALFYFLMVSKAKISVNKSQGGLGLAMLCLLPSVYSRYLRNCCKNTRDEEDGAFVH